MSNQSIEELLNDIEYDIGCGGTVDCHADDEGKFFHEEFATLRSRISELKKDRERLQGLYKMARNHTIELHWNNNDNDFCVKVKDTLYCAHDEPGNAIDQAVSQILFDELIQVVEGTDDEVQS